MKEIIGERIGNPDQEFQRIAGVTLKVANAPPPVPSNAPPDLGTAAIIQKEIVEATKASIKEVRKQT